MNRDAIQNALGHRFGDQHLLEQALTHRSYGVPHNERLEFIGDGLLNCVIALALYQRFPELDEGSLSRLRAGLVKQESLHQLALKLDLGQSLRLGEGELRSGGHRRPSILADAMEALFGATYLDAGFAVVQRMICALYADMIAAIDPKQAGKDPKTSLQEWLQGHHQALPHYEMLNIRGEAHAQEFEVVCRLADLGFETTGLGPSRRAAEQQAARAALDRIEAL